MIDMIERVARPFLEVIGQKHITLPLGIFQPPAGNVEILTFALNPDEGFTHLDGCDSGSS